MVGITIVTIMIIKYTNDMSKQQWHGNCQVFYSYFYHDGTFSDSLSFPKFVITSFLSRVIIMGTVIIIIRMYY